MTSKVYIGQNTCVDLSSCYDMLNDMSKEDVYALVERCSNGQEYVLPAQNLIEISEYLDKKGIKDDEKDKYLELQLSHILGKEDGVDQGLKELMLKSQAMHNNGSAEIVYNDGAIEVFDLTPKRDRQLAYNIALAAQKSR